MRKFFRFISAVSFALCAVLFVMIAATAQSIPDLFYVKEGESLRIETFFSVTATAVVQENFVDLSGAQKVTQENELQLCIFETIPVKTVTYQTVPEQSVVVSGSPFGLKMLTNGVIVVGFGEVDSENGICNPAKEAGVALGDVIVAINGEKMSSNTDVSEAVSNSQGEPLHLEIRRGTSDMNLTIYPKRSQSENIYKIGMWVRDSSAGIGTMTFIDPNTHVFGGLGHAVCDVDTGEIMPLSEGDIVPVSITGIVKGQAGIAGELRGVFSSYETNGTIYLNEETGIYGTIRNIPASQYVLPVGLKQEIEEGPAQVLCTLEGNKPQVYSIFIEKINMNDPSLVKNMVIRITDPELLQKTGGIVQGMSGSPIMQNGRFVGAVTHVFLNDPTRGYAIFAENMISTAEDVEERIFDKVS